MSKYVLAQYNFDNPPQGFGVVDLGTLTWYKQVVNESMTVFYSNVLYAAKKDTHNLKCANYTTHKTSNYYRNLNDKEISFYNSNDNNVTIRDESLSSLTAAQFKAAMSGVKLLYELASNTIPYTSVPCSYYALYHNINLWDEQWRLGFFENGVFIGTVPSIQRLCSKNPIKVTPGSTLKVNVNPIDAYYIYQFDSNMSFIGETHFAYSTTGYQAELANNCEYIQFSSRDNKTGYKVHTVMYTGTKSEDAINTNQYLLEVLIK